MDVPASANQLNAAKADLDKGDLKAADSALADAQRAVIAASVAADLPLVWARENLVLAKNRAQAGDWSGTRNALNSASDALNNYASASRTPHANDTRDLRKQIDDYSADLDQNHSDAVNKIQGWWEQATDWTSPAPANTNQRASR